MPLLTTLILQIFLIYEVITWGRTMDGDAYKQESAKLQLNTISVPHQLVYLELHALQTYN